MEKTTEEITAKVVVQDMHARLRKQPETELPDDTRIEFCTSTGAVFVVKLNENGGIQIYKRKGEIAVHPHVSNVIQIQ